MSWLSNVINPWNDSMDSADDLAVAWPGFHPHRCAGTAFGLGLGGESGPADCHPEEQHRADADAFAALDGGIPSRTMAAP